MIKRTDYLTRTYDKPEGWTIGVYERLGGYQSVENEYLATIDGCRAGQTHAIASDVAAAPCARRKSRCVGSEFTRLRMSEVRIPKRRASSASEAMSAKGW